MSLSSVSIDSCDVCMILTFLSSSKFSSDSFSSKFSSDSFSSKFSCDYFSSNSFSSNSNITSVIISDIINISLFSEKALKVILFVIFLHS